MWRRADRFSDLVQRQLDVLAADEADLLSEIEEAEKRWNEAGREGAEEAYGDYQLAVDALADRLVETREAYAASMAPDAADVYRRSFSHAAARRFRRHPTIAADLAEDDA
jgi:hypothetical protein